MSERERKKRGEKNQFRTQRKLTAIARIDPISHETLSHTSQLSGAWTEGGSTLKKFLFINISIDRHIL
jgi:hypothetical protein